MTWAARPGTLLFVPDSPAKIAAAVREGVPACSVVRLWGANAFRPADLIYDVTNATAPDEHTLRIDLYLALENEHVTVEVKDPDWWQVVDGSLDVRRASSVSWAGLVQRPGAPGAFALHLGH